MRKCRNGFTLIELVIVMLVIGVFAAMMMFSSTEAESSARAQSIVNNFMQIQKAVSSWYADNMDRIVTNGTNSGNVVYNIVDANNKKLALTEFVQDNSKEITKYLNKGSNIKLVGKRAKKINPGDYLLVDVDYKNWYVCYNTGTDTKLQSKLAGRAKSLGLFAVNNDFKPQSQNYTGGQYVSMFVLDLDK